MSIEPSIIPWLSLTGCLIGLTSAIALQVWTNGIDYKIALSGKPFIAFPAFVPVTFELTILFTAFFTAFGMFGINKLRLGTSQFLIMNQLKKQHVQGSFYQSHLMIRILMKKRQNYF